jgi:putative SOS response-associated peptidase YedK
MPVPFHAKQMAAWEVSPRVNSPRHNGSKLVERYSGGQPPAAAVDVPDSA